MSETDPEQVLSRLSDEDSLAAKASCGKSTCWQPRSFATLRHNAANSSSSPPPRRQSPTARRAANALVLGAPLVGKTKAAQELDRCLEKAGSRAIYYP